MGNIGETSKPKNISVNAHMVQMWIHIIREAGLTPYVLFAPGISQRESFGLPRGFVDNLRAADCTNADRVKRKRKKGEKKPQDEVSVIAIGSRSYGSKPLNVGMRAARMVHVDTENGVLYLDVRINGLACPNIALPIETIVSVYAKEDPNMGSEATGFSVVGMYDAAVNIFKSEVYVTYLDPDVNAAAGHYEMHGTLPGDWKERFTDEVAARQHRAVIGIVGGTEFKKPEQSAEDDSDVENSPENTGHPKPEIDEKSTQTQDVRVDAESVENEPRVAQVVSLAERRRLIAEAQRNG